jgi:hypothetical protein
LNANLFEMFCYVHKCFNADLFVFLQSRHNRPAHADLQTDTDHGTRKRAGRHRESSSKLIEGLPHSLSRSSTTQQWQQNSATKSDSDQIIYHHSTMVSEAANPYPTVSSMRAVPAFTDNPMLAWSVTAASECIPDTSGMHSVPRPATDRASSALSHACLLVQEVAVEVAAAGGAAEAAAIMAATLGPDGRLRLHWPPLLPDQLQQQRAQLQQQRHS